MKKFFLFAAAVLGFAACTPEKPVECPDLEISFDKESYSLPLDSRQTVEFIVTGIDGAAVETSAAVANSTDWSVECTLDAKAGKGVLTVNTPAKLSVTTATVVVTDKANNRTAEKIIALASTAEGLADIEVYFTGESHEVTAGGEALVMEFKVTGLGNAVLEPPTEASITTALTIAAVSWNASDATGAVTVSAAVNAPAGENTVTLKVKDNYNREAVCNAAVQVKANPDTPAKTSYNCYIVKPGESIEFKCKYETITSLDIAWQDAATLVKKLSIEDGKVKVETDNTPGNALVTGKNAAGTVLWSWHIWVVDFNPEATAVTVDGVTFMDRNLGAINATPGDVGAIGQAYQWGRKDPLPRVIDKTEYIVYDADGNSIKVDSGSHTWYKIQQGGTLAESIANPDKFFKALGDRSWIKDKDYQDWWGGVSLAKSDYDPCPEGWKVPVITNGKNPFAFMKAKSAVYDETNIGILYTGTDNKTLWFPSNGQRSRSKGWIHEVDSDGNYWLGTDKPELVENNKYKSAEYLSFTKEDVGLGETAGRPIYQVLGCGVRCVKE